MLSREAFIRLSLLTIFSWVFVLGIFIEMVDTEPELPEQIAIKGTVLEITYNEPLTRWDMHLYDGEREWILSFDDSLTVPRRGSEVFVVCAIGHGSEIEISQIILL